MIMGIIEGEFPPIEKNYIGAEIELPAPRSIEVQFDIVLKSRRSLRNFDDSPLSLSDLSTLLHHAIGLQSLRFTDGFGVVQRRPYPSPGARHSLEFYVFVENVHGLTPGTYHVNSSGSKLECASVGSLLKRATDIRWATTAPLLLFITSVGQRIKIKYPRAERRFQLLEAGHAAQNIYLALSAMQLAGCAIGSWNSRFLEKSLRLNSEEEQLLYGIAIGNRLAVDQGGTAR